MSEGVNLFDLAATIRIDATQSDKVLTSTQQKVLAMAEQFKKAEQTSVASFSKVSGAAHGLEGSVHKLTEVFKEIGAASVVLEGPFGGMSSRLRGLSTLANTLGGSFGLVGIGIAGAGAAALGAAGLIFELTKHTAEAGEEIFKLHEKTN